MSEEKIVIRREREEDERSVEDLIRESFWNVYRPGCLEHYVIHQLRNDPAFVPELDLVMERAGYKKIKQATEALPNAKALVRTDYRKDK